MKRVALILSIVLFAAIPADAALERQIIGSEQDHSADSAGDCEHFYKTTFTTFTQQVSDSEQRELSLTGAEPQLRVDASQEGGVSIRGWNKPFARLQVCRFAAANSREQAQRALGAITVSFANGRIEALGPQNDNTQAWWVNMTLFVPKGTYVDVRAKNGGVAIRNMNGRVKASATGGGISVVQSIGKYVISTDSGGITLDRITGRAEAYSRAGSVALKVQQSSTTAPKIEARTASAHILCALKNCDAGLGKWAADKRSLTIGTAPPDFRITTTGSPIMIGAAVN
ncbi:MAG TPA: hypothetical protein VHW00_22865 [Thermoanaerobaculia bacterium]|nr:hypothetical protein [Thermoanaerobaculia bacterium]